MFKSTKRFVGFSCAHRQPSHDGHCQYLHGYSRSFYFIFGADEVDPRTHFVMDFSGLKGVKAWLDNMFDHTCLINADDPELELFKQLDERGIIQLRVLPNVSMEATAKYVVDHVQTMLDEVTGGRVFIHACECRENDKNSGWYYPRGGADDISQATSEIGDS
ncbi:MAG: 6-carboxytetrahydropterin synthase [Chromatiales bacterium]|nr:6-carboxytetrahydropterin synthase [Chromatiales bacterium]